MNIEILLLCLFERPLFLCHIELKIDVDSSGEVTSMSTAAGFPGVQVDMKMSPGLFLLSGIKLFFPKTGERFAVE